MLKIPNPVINELLNKYNIIYKKNTEEDIKLILSAKYLVESFSSFTHSLSVISKNLKVIFRPHYQNNRLNNFLIKKNVSIFSLTISDYWEKMAPWIEYTNEKRLFMLNYKLKHRLIPVNPNFSKVYVSLTSISPRVNKLITTLKSILNQTVIPDKIFLYLSEEEYLIDKGFKNKILPNHLKKFINENSNILELNWVENTGPYRKLLPTLKKKWKENCLIITIDDDFIYNKNLIEKHIYYYHIHNCCIGFRGKTYKNLDNFDYNKVYTHIPKYKYNFLTGLVVYYINKLLLDLKFYLIRIIIKNIVNR